MPRYALKVFYIGTNYYGFQRQTKFKTIEGCLFEAFQKAELIDDPLTFRYRAAGRTDRGVHALGQVIAFSTSNVRLSQLNAYLPEDIRFWAIAKVAEEFNPRFDALSKHYKYFLPYGENMNLEEMKHATDYLIGIHNFKNLSKINHLANPIREIIQLKLTKLNNILQIDVIAKSLLWQMIRKIASVLSFIGKGLMSINELKKLLDPNFIHQKGIPPAPAWGLLLYDVHYNSLNFVRDYKVVNEITSQLKDEISRLSCLKKVFDEICTGIY
ncbi:MAG: tRNA pseudouridine(38-40) synthase TruA [Promethearchaeota archaeon]